MEALKTILIPRAQNNRAKPCFFLPLASRFKASTPRYQVCRNNYHVQDCSSKDSSQFYDSCSSGELFTSPTSSRGHCGRETRPTVVRPWSRTNRTDFRPPQFSVSRDLARTLINPPKLWKHGPAVKAETSRCVGLSPYHPHATIN